MTTKSSYLGQEIETTDEPQNIATDSSDSLSTTRSPIKFRTKAPGKGRGKTMPHGRCNPFGLRKPNCNGKGKGPKKPLNGKKA